MAPKLFPFFSISLGDSRRKTVIFVSIKKGHKELQSFKSLKHRKRPQQCALFSVYCRWAEWESIVYPPPSLRDSP